MDEDFPPQQQSADDPEAEKALRRRWYLKHGWKGDAPASKRPQPSKRTPLAPHVDESELLIRSIYSTYACNQSQGRYV